MELGGVHLIRSSYYANLCESLRKEGLLPDSF